MIKEPSDAVKRFRKLLARMTPKQRTKCAGDTGISTYGLRKILIGSTRRMHSSTENKLNEWFKEKD